MFDRVALDWSVGWMKERRGLPERFVPALVPGAVQLDWARAEGWGDFHHQTSFTAFQWMEDVCWLYRARLDFRALQPGERLFFCCAGVDYRFDIRANGRVLFRQEGMFTPVALDLTGHVAPGELLEVLVYPAPKSVREPATRDQANQSCKPAVSYGWDFHPRLIPLGIWGETFLEIRTAGHLQDAEVSFTLSEDLTRARLQLEVQCSEVGAQQLRWSLYDPDGALLVQLQRPLTRRHLRMTHQLAQPALWWPNGQGAAHLYTSVVELLDAQGAVCDLRRLHTGLRRVRLLMHPTQWEELGEAVPIGPNTAPITLEINGRRIFAKGANWVSPDIFPGRISAERYDTLLGLAHDAHFNLLRCWGGAIVPHEAFFTRCDELGLMVWQEFPLACNRYEGTPAYLAVLDRESRSIIKRLRRHAALTLWCGGNELCNSWSRMTDQDAALRLLNRNCYDLDPAHPFLLSSPRMGMGHGGYGFRVRQQEEVYQYLPKAQCNAYTEIGCGGPAAVETFRRYLPDDAIVLSGEKPAISLNPAYAWDEARVCWLPGHLAPYFAATDSLEEYIARAQWLQSEAYRFIYEEARRQKPRAAMVLSWVYNEPWPMLANGSIVSWPDNPKPSYAAVRAACRPVLFSARFPQFSWRAEEIFSAELWLLNDTPEAVPPGHLEALLCTPAGDYPLGQWEHPGAPPNENCPGPTFTLPLPTFAASAMRLELRGLEHPEWGSEYTLRYFGEGEALT